MNIQRMNIQRMNMLTIGGATTDMFIAYKDASWLNFDSEHEKRSFLLLEEGQKITLDTLVLHTGGGATNSAVSFKQLGFDVSIFCKLGNDKPAEFIMQRLQQSTINTQYIERTSAYRTGHSFIIPCKDGDRIVLVYRGANAHIKEDELPLDALNNYKNIYITSLPGEASHLLVPIARTAKEHGALVATNPGSSQLKLGSHDMYKALPHIDIFILNSHEACTFMLSMIQQNIELHQKVLDTKLKKQPPELSLPHTQQAQLMKRPISYQTVCFDIRLFFKEVLSKGPQIVVVTNGAEGVYVATKDEIVFHPSLPGHIENTLGAGDAFGSCFVAKYIEGASIKEAMLYGILNAASVISHLDAKSGLLSSDELEQRLQNAPKDLFQTFSLE